MIPPEELKKLASTGVEYESREHGTHITLYECDLPLDAAGEIVGGQGAVGTVGTKKTSNHHLFSYEK